MFKASLGNYLKSKKKERVQWQNLPNMYKAPVSSIPRERRKGGTKKQGVRLILGMRAKGLSQGTYRGRYQHVRPI